MAYADPNRTDFAAPSAIAGVPSGLLGHLVAAWAVWRTQRHALAELQALDDATLADLGWNRGELPGMALRGAR